MQRYKTFLQKIKKLKFTNLTYFFLILYRYLAIYAQFLSFRILDDILLKLPKSAFTRLAFS